MNCPNCGCPAQRHPDEEFGYICEECERNAAAADDADEAEERVEQFFGTTTWRELPSTRLDIALAQLDDALAREIVTYELEQRA